MRCRDREVGRRIGRLPQQTLYGVPSPDHVARGEYRRDQGGAPASAPPCGRMERMALRIAWSEFAVSVSLTNPAPSSPRAFGSLAVNTRRVPGFSSRIAP